MDTRNCKICGRLFTYVRSPFCHECTKRLEEKFKQVKEYIYEHPGAGITEVSEENDVSKSIIRYWVREERLSFSKDSHVDFVCEKCGTSISTGRFCKKCKKEVQRDLQKVYAVEPIEKKKQQGSSQAKMRFIGHRDVQQNQKS